MGCHFPPPEDLPDLGNKPRHPVSPALQAGSLPSEPLSKSNLLPFETCLSGIPASSSKHLFSKEYQNHWSLFSLLHGFPDSSVGEESSCNAGDPGSSPGSGKSTGEGIGYPLQYSGLENSMGYIVHGVTKSPTRLRDFHFSLLHSFCCSMMQKGELYF